MAEIDEYIGFWEEFNDDSRFIRMQEDEDEPDDSLAVKVIETFGLTCVGTLGGPLATVDIKRMDALKAMNASLLESFARGETSSFVEAVVTEEGHIDFKVVGSYVGLEDVDIYHTIPTQTYRNICKGVMVHGGKPTPRRRSTAWTPVWGTNEADKEIFTTAEKMQTNCLKENFDQYATIVFNDPHIRSSQYEDGIDNLYEISKENPWDNIVGYAIRKEFTPDIKEYIKDRPEITIDYVNQCSIPIEVAKNLTAEGEAPPDNWSPEVGPLVFAPVAPSNLGNPEEEGCWTQPGIGDIARYPENSRDPVTSEWAKDNGIKIEIPEKFRYEIRDVEGEEDLKIDKLNGISKVYLVGIYMDSCQGFPESEADQITTSTQNNTKLVAVIEDSATKVFEAQEGIHFKVFYDPEKENSDGTFKTPYLVFTDNSRIGDNAKFGSDCSFYISPECEYAQNQELDSPDLEQENQTVIPTNGVECMWVKQIWVLADLETPGIKIYDPDGLALDIANGLSYLMKPLVLIDKPAPIGYAGESSSNGRVIDLVSGKVDHDPTTAQDLEDTDFERALDEMSEGGSGLSLTLTFLVADIDEDVDSSTEDSGETLVKNFSSKLYDYMTEYDGVQTTHICGPSTKVNIGGEGINRGTVINSIDYSYNDSGSYTISVTEGSTMYGSFAEISEGVSQKAVEEQGFTGTIIQDMGTNLHYKIRIDGYGERIGINTCPSVIRVGDRISGSIHNNPVEL